ALRSARPARRSSRYLLQLVVKRGVCLGERRRDRSFSDLERRRDLRVREAREVAQEDDEPPARRQRANRRRQSGVALWIEDRQVLRQLLESRALALAEHEPERDLPDPGCKRCVGAQLVALAQRDRERLLHDVVRRLVAADDRRQRVAKAGIPFAVELLE